MYCHLSTASEVFLILTTQQSQYFSVSSYTSPICTILPEVFVPKHFQTAILHAAHYQRGVKGNQKYSGQMSQIFKTVKTIDIQSVKQTEVCGKV